MRKISLLGLSIGMLLVAALLVTALPIAAQAQQPPQLTNMVTWGTVTLDGDAAPIGTAVEVFIGTDSTPSGSRDVFAAGEYGGIVVSALDTRIGEALTYKVDGFVAKKLGPDEGVFGYEIQVVNLQAVSDSSSTKWTFTGAGSFPKHLPDSYYGEVVLDTLLNVPAEVQGVYWWDSAAVEWRFWAPGVPGCTLNILGGGHTYDYVVSVVGPHEWNIPLQ